MKIILNVFPVKCGEISAWSFLVGLLRVGAVSTEGQIAVVESSFAQ